MIPFLYRIGTGLYHTSIRIAAWFSPKAKAWVAGRQHWQECLKTWRQTIGAEERIIWMHCASLGEFEQGRPVLERIRSTHPTYRIVLTFYSPSGYEQQANYQHADYIAYLPADTPANAREWAEMLQPSLVIFVKYEFWAFHLQALFKKQIPVVLIAGTFRSNQLFFRWYGRFFLQLLRGFAHLFVQTQADHALLSSYGLRAITVAGDPRVDRVLAIAQQDIDFPLIASFKQKDKLFIGGSTWPAGEAILLGDQHRWQGDWKLLLAPHDISASHLQQLEALIELPYCWYSQIEEQEQWQDCRVMILDTIGMLSRVYHYGELAYIGGGFGKSIHNTLEPAAHGLPVLFGPHHQKFQEAIVLKAAGGAFEIREEADFHRYFELLQQKETMEQARSAVHSYLNANRGATELIVEQLEL